MDRIEAQCPKLAEIKDERVLIFGGSGSLGTTVINSWISNNHIINVSRDEEKQWLLKTNIKEPKANLTQIVGDIANQEDVINAVLESKPTIICVFACLKHIDLCEKNPKKSIDINTTGIINVHKALQRHAHNVKSVLFVSTDKACLPITAYGCSKFLAECYIQGIRDDKTKWVGIRYGNVLNSSGSIIPHLNLHKESKLSYTLTHPDMTRFIMTLEQSVHLIEYALEFGKNNEIIVPKINSMKIKDLFELFCEKYEKDYKITGLRCKEKIHEDLISASEASFSYSTNDYIHVTTQSQKSNTVTSFDSSMNLVSKDILKTYLETKKLL